MISSKACTALHEKGWKQLFLSEHCESCVSNVETLEAQVLSNSYSFVGKWQNLHVNNSGQLFAWFFFKKPSSKPAKPVFIFYNVTWGYYHVTWGYHPIDAPTPLFGWTVRPGIDTRLPKVAIFLHCGAHRSHFTKVCHQGCPIPSLTAPRRWGWCCGTLMVIAPGAPGVMACGSWKVVGSTGAGKQGCYQGSLCDNNYP